MIIDGKDSILGRIASKAAKSAREGEEVVIINADGLCIIGNKNAIINKYREKMRIGTASKGPFVKKTVDGIVMSAIKGMIGKDSEIGRTAMKKIKVFSGVPEEYKGKDALQMDKISQEKPVHKLSVGELSRLLKG